MLLMKIGCQAVPKLKILDVFLVVDNYKYASLRLQSVAGHAMHL